MERRSHDPYAPANDTAEPEPTVDEAPPEPVQEQPLDDYPADGSAAEVLAWVGDDQRRIGFAITRELERPESKRRKTVLALGD